MLSSRKICIDILFNYYVLVHARESMIFRMFLIYGLLLGAPKEFYYSSLVEDNFCDLLGFNVGPFCFLGNPSYL